MLYSTDPAVRGGREELCPGLAGDPHRLEDGLGVGRGETDLPHRFAPQPVVPVANLAVITASSQQGDLARVVVARYQVVRTLQLQHGVGRIL